MKSLIYLVMIILVFSVFVLGDEEPVFNCPPFPDLAECESPAYPIPTYDSSGCLVNYECTDGEDCYSEYEVCMSGANSRKIECEALPLSNGCSEQFEEDSRVCNSEYYECNVRDEEAVEGESETSIIEGVKLKYLLRNVDIDQEQIKEFLSFIIGLPGGSSIANDKINLYVIKEDGTVQSFGIRLQNGDLVEVMDKPYEDYGFSFTFGEKIINKILTAEDPKEEAVKALMSKDIKVKGGSLFDRIKVFFLKLFLRFV